MRLTDRILASGVSLTDLIHIVITGDTTQSPEGSSYKASISQVKSLFGDAIIITGTGVTSSIRKDSGNLASGNFSSSIPGSGNTSSGHLSYSEGENTISSGRTSHSEGSNTTAGGNNSHAEGEWTRALGVSSHAEGNTTYSIGNYSHSEGFETIARGISSHAQGDSTSAYGDYSHAGGLSSTVSGNTSFVHSKDSAVYSDYSSILGGSSNTISGLTVSSGSSNNTAIIGGNNNLINNQTIFNGYSNGIGESINSTIIGGQYNSIYGHKNSSIIGGSGNTIHFDFPATYNDSEVIAGSINSLISATTISSIISSSGSTLFANNQSSILGGKNNFITFYDNSIIIGGENNTIGELGEPTGPGINTVIVGGKNNKTTVGLLQSVILGGENITATTNNMVYVPDLIIDGLINVTDLQTNSNGQLVDGTSDARLKQNINELTNSLDIINNLRGVSFEYTPESKMGDGIRYGFIAQEVQQHVPDIVRSRTKDDGMLSLNYNEIVPILVESVKELSSKLTLTIPVFTPTSSNDTTGNEGEITRDDNYMYVKTNSGWKRSSLEQF